MAITKLNQKMIKDLETEISGFKSESMKQRKMLYTLEKEREKYGAEASDANAKFGTALEEAWRRPLDRASRRIARARSGCSLCCIANLLAALLMQVKLREMTILDLQKKISEGDGKLKQQQTLCRSPRLRLAPAPAMPLARVQPRELPRHLCALARKRRYEAVRADRNLYSKNLIESQVRARAP